MFYKFQRRYNLLTVNDSFAHLKTILPNGSLQFEFRYDISQREAVQRNALSVKVSVLSRTITGRSLLGNTQAGTVDTRALVNNILSQLPDAKSTLKKQEEYSIVETTSDVLAFINNEILSQLKSAGTSDKIDSLRHSTLKLITAGEVKQDNNEYPTLTSAVPLGVTNSEPITSSSLSVDPQDLIHDMIIRQGIDPSFATELTHRSKLASETRGGLLTPSRAQEFDNSPVTQLTNFYLFDPVSFQQPSSTNDLSDQDHVHALVSDYNEIIEIPVNVTIPNYAFTAEGRQVSHFLIKFELINGANGATLDTVIKPLDTVRHVLLYYTPKIPPSVKLITNQVTSIASLEIKQNDPGGVAVKVFKKVVYSSTTDVDSYALIGTYNVSYGHHILVRAHTSNQSAVVYRVVAVGTHGAVGFDFTNVVIKPPRFQPKKSLSLTLQVIDTGVKIEARYIPKRATAIEFITKNHTIFDRVWSNVGGDINLIDDNVRSLDYITVTDTDVNANNVYEYAARIIFRTGETQIVGNTLIEFLHPDPGKVDTTLSNVVVDNDDVTDVSFDIATNVIDGSSDTLKNLLESNGIYDQYSADLQAEKEFFKSLLAHNVQRVDLTSGQRVDFGVLSKTHFSDKDLRKTYAIDPPQLDHKYRYEVQALLRDPNTLFDSKVQQAVDSTTKKPYTFNPAKYLHPIALTRGVLMSRRGLTEQFAKDPMSFGTIGSVTTVEVSFDDDTAKIIEATVARFDDYTVVVNWRIQGLIDRIDHFVLMSDVNGSRTIIGKAHNYFTNGNCQFLHQLTSRDVGELSYVIVPVFSDYNVGQAAETNSVLIEVS